MINGIGDFVEDIPYVAQGWHGEIISKLQGSIDSREEVVWQMKNPLNAFYTRERIEPRPLERITQARIRFPRVPHRAAHSAQLSGQFSQFGRPVLSALTTCNACNCRFGESTQLVLTGHRARIQAGLLTPRSDGRIANPTDHDDCGRLSRIMWLVSIEASLLRPPGSKKIPRALMSLTRYQVQRGLSVRQQRLIEWCRQRNVAIIHGRR